MNNTVRKSTMTLDEIENQMVEYLTKSFEYTAYAHGSTTKLSIDSFFDKISSRVDSHLTGYTADNKHILKVRTMKKLAANSKITITFYETEQAQDPAPNDLQSHYFLLENDPVKPRRLRHRKPRELTSNDHIFNHITHEIDTRMMELPESYNIANLVVQYTHHGSLSLSIDLIDRIFAYYENLEYSVGYVVNTLQITVSCQ